MGCVLYHDAPIGSCFYSWLSCYLFHCAKVTNIHQFKLLKCNYLNWPFVMYCIIVRFDIIVYNSQFWYFFRWTTNQFPTDVQLIKVLKTADYSAIKGWCHSEQRSRDLRGFKTKETLLKWKSKRLLPSKIQCFGLHLWCGHRGSQEDVTENKLSWWANTHSPKSQTTEGKQMKVQGREPKRNTKLKTNQKLQRTQREDRRHTWVGGTCRGTQEKREMQA